MIKKIFIDGYQSICNTQLEFDPGINIITGETDTGKSAVARTLYAVVNNESGEDFINGRKENCKAEMILEDDTKITWLKPQNSYIINDDKNRTFKRVGVKAPDEIKSLINMDEVRFGQKSKFSKDINFLMQHNTKFMIQDKGTECAEIIGKLTNIHKIYNAIRSSSSDKSKNLKEFNRLDKEIIEKNKTLIPFGNLDLKKKMIKDLKSNINIVNDSVNKYENLDLFKKSLETLNLSIRNYVEKIDKFSKTIKTSKNLDKFEKDFIKLNKLIRLQNTISNNKIKIKNSQKEFSKFKHISSIDQKKFNSIEKNLLEFNSLILLKNRKKKNKIQMTNFLKELKKSNYISDISNENLDGLNKAVTKLLDLIKVNNTFKTLRSNQNESWNNFNESSDTLKDNKNNFKDFLTENKICPTCSQEITEKCIKKIINS